MRNENADNERKKHHRGRRRKKKGNIIANVILVIALIVFCVSGFQLFKIGKGYLDGRSEYDKVRKLAVTDDKNKNDKDKNHSEDGDDTFSIDFQKLNVDNQKDFSDKNSVIYGHRMRDGSMFRHLQDYDTREFWKNNPYFYIYTVDGRILKYHIYSAGQVVDTSESYQTTFETDEEYQEFLNMTQSTSLYNTGVEVTTADTIVTLSTCTSASDNHRFVVRGVKEEETKQ